jgi:hypothetical protein
LAVRPSLPLPVGLAIRSGLATLPILLVLARLAGQASPPVLISPPGQASPLVLVEPAEVAGLTRVDGLNRVAILSRVAGGFLQGQRATLGDQFAPVTQCVLQTGIVNHGHAFMNI